MSVFVFTEEKFKKPADDEDIYEPNRPTKSTKARVNDITYPFFSSYYFPSRHQSGPVFNKPTSLCPIHFQRRLDVIYCFSFMFRCLLNKKQVDCMRCES